jgi:microsomal dipeptidase-like Zn-dependent dipeptidase
LLWSRDLLSRSTRGHIDLPRLQAGNVALQVFSSVSQTPRGQNYQSNPDNDILWALVMAQQQPGRTWFSPLERSLFHARKLDAAVAASEGQLTVIRTRADVARLLAARARGQRTTGALFSVEGLQNLEGDFANLDRLYRAGVRMAGLTHFFDNAVAGSMHGQRKGGLTPLGRRVVTEMERRGMIIDIAHSSHRTVAEVLAMATRPVVSSHGGVQATCAENRNLSDEEIRGVAHTGGVIGVGVWDAAVCGTEPADTARAMRHIRDLVGIDHVGLGTDFDGAVTAGYDVSRIALITQALIDQGFTDEEIAKAMGGNVLRVLGEALPER